MPPSRRRSGGAFGLADVLELLQDLDFHHEAAVAWNHAHRRSTANRLKRRLQPLVTRRAISPPGLEERRTDGRVRINTPLGEHAARFLDSLFTSDPEIVIHLVDDLIPEPFMVDGRDKERVGDRFFRRRGDLAGAKEGRHRHAAPYLAASKQQGEGGGGNRASVTDHRARSVPRVAGMGKTNFGNFPVSAIVLVSGKSQSLGVPIWSRVMKRSFGPLLLVVLLAAFLIPTSPQPAVAQGFLLVDKGPGVILPPHPLPRPRPPQVSQLYQLKQLAVSGVVNDQVARLQFSQTFVNQGSTTLEASFVFPLPHDGAVEGLAFLVDGKEYEAKLLDANEARQIYESYVRRNRDPALLEWLGMGLFKTSVFPIPAGAERTVTLRFSQVLRQSGGVTELDLPWAAARYSALPVENLSINLQLATRTPLKNVFSPSHPLNIQRPDDKHAVVSYSATKDVPRGDFRLLFDVGREAIGASVLSYRPSTSDEGYFLLMATPEVKAGDAEVLRKNVVFVVDRSGSMSGPKIEQAKNALRFVLNNLREGDLFNIIAYDTEVDRFRPEMQRFNEENRKAALGYVEGIYPGGSTNIDGGLNAAFEMLTDAARPNYVLFLTDGLPTAGVTKEAEIVDRSQKRNQVRARVFAFGVGYDVNSRLLDRLARVGFGQSEYVRPNEDIEAHVSRLYGRIGAPALTDVKLELRSVGASAEEATGFNRLYPKQVYDLYAGDQLIVVGRYRKPGPAKVRLAGTVNGEARSFEFDVELAEKSASGAPAFIEKLWAMRRVGEIIDQIDLQGQNQELVEELVALSKKHGILTPYTSFLADDQPTPAGLAGVAASREKASERLRALSVDSGRSGVAQRANKGMLQSAATAPASGGASFADAETDVRIVVESVQAIAEKTFYRRGDRWVDESIDRLGERELQQAIKVKRYSDEFFLLANKYGREAAPYLALEGRVLIKLGEELVEIED